MQWNFASTDRPITIEELLSLLMANRGLEPELQKQFLEPLSPNDLTLQDVGLDASQVKIALDRLKQARDAQEKVLVFGDYDADGISATAVLWQTLHAAGFDALPFIPDRQRHGYGLSVAALQEILQSSERAPQLVMTVDNGIVATEAANFLQEQGIDLIITDHHSPDEAQQPKALAIVHTTQLCGATVAWMFSREIAQTFASNQAIQSVQAALDLCAVATIADQVPLLKANRSFAYHGLAAIRTSQRPGLKALLQQANAVQLEVTEDTVNFVIAPRINAMGRLKHGMDALRLLCSNSESRVGELANTLGSTNDTRKNVTYEQYQHAFQLAKEKAEQHIIIVASEEYHEGVIGLIAGRLAERFFKPAIVLSIGDGVAKASARSVPGVNIVELIREVRDELLEVGGHPMAAGFGLELGNLASVTHRLEQLAITSISDTLLQPQLELECVLPHQLLTLETADALRALAPFGQKNPQPVFGLQNLQLLDAQTIGKDSKHLKLFVSTGDPDSPLEVMFWRKGFLAEKLPQSGAISIAAKLDINEWRGRRKLQLIAEDVRVEEY